MKKKHLSTKKLTNITRAIIYLIGIAVFSVCAILLPELAREEAVGKATPPLVWPFFVGAWILSLPIFAALYSALRILTYIDENNAFSNKSYIALQQIKLCAITFGALMAVATLAVINLVLSTDPKDDPPPVRLFGGIWVFASIIIATFVAVLQKLLKHVIDIKSENDLIV